ncbi:MAG: pilin [Actinobacteria bacterium]|nr:pilin [Actinomycetota bacterium]
MLKTIRSIALSFVLLAGIAAPLAVPGNINAQDLLRDDGGISGNLDSGAFSTDRTADEDPSGAEDQVQGIITTTINIFSLVVGVISVIMIIIGGLKYITSGGDSGNVTGAKNTILYAVIGLVVVALAQVIVRFVLNTTTGQV